MKGAEGGQDERFVCRWLAVSAALHLAAAALSRGWQAADEYFQILEFASYKLGLTPLDRMPYELTAEMRSWFQPGAAWLIARAHQAVGIEDPFLWTFWMRLISGFLGWASGAAWLAEVWTTGWSREAKRLATVCVATLWFLPALHARPSSESWGGSFFMLGLAILLGSPRWGKPERRSRWELAGGACLAAAFESRFQMGVCLAGLAGWLAWKREWGWAKAARVAGAFAAVFAAGRAIDAWGYGHWVFSPWKYVQFNLVRGEVNRFGPSPWWDLARMANTEAWPVLGFGLLVAALAAWVRHWRSPWTWAFAPLLLVHNAIPHKELRFYFPIAAAGAVWVLFSLTDRRGRLLRLPGALWAGVAGWNAVALVALTATPAHRSALMFEEIYRRVSGGRNAPVLLASGGSPYYFLGSHTFFYRPRGLDVVEVREPSDAWAALRAARRPVLFYHQELGPPPAVLRDARLAARCREVYRNFPWGFEALVEAGNPLLGWKGRFNARSLWECEATE